MKIITFFFVGLLGLGCPLTELHSRDELLLPRLRIIADALTNDDAVIVIGRSRPVNVNEISEIKNDYGDTLFAFYSMMKKDKDIERLSGSISRRYTDSVLKGRIDSSWFLLYEQPYSGVKDINDLFRDVHGGYWLYVLLPIEAKKEVVPSFIKPRVDSDISIISGKDFFRKDLFFKSYFHEGRSLVRVTLNDVVDCPYKSEILVEHAMFNLSETEEVLSFIKMVVNGQEVDSDFGKTDVGRKLVELYSAKITDRN